jgi:hypothetical protein
MTLKFVTEFGKQIYAVLFGVFYLVLSNSICSTSCGSIFVVSKVKFPIMYIRHAYASVALSVLLKP